MVEEEFNNKFLPNTGYKQYRCRKCGERFWSITPREVCPDRPCSKYDFLKKTYPRVKKLSFDQARKSFIDYFVSRGHGYIEPYPVLARWRNDLYLTIASIIVFQPAVTEGIVDPPYNPLVIVQPSVRLEDIDNVGLTFGRHLTSFEMGGHHAFNKGDKKIYWVEETLRYAYEYFTEIIGIDPEDVVFKESWWEGGGNAGPAYEVLVDGLELATLVFMKYKVVDGQRQLNPVLVVDTGYGIERIAWFTQKTPTAFHAVFGDLVKKYSDILNVQEPPHDVLKEIVYILSDIDVKDVYELEEHLIRNGYEDYIDNMLNSINLYTALDHVKTISLMLSDGIVPSNTGEGYLARLVIRRLLRTLLRIGIEPSRLEDTVLELVAKQAEYWTGRYVYDKFHRHLDYIAEVLSIETRKYIDVITSGSREIEKIIKRKKTLTLTDLIEIYDSKGIPPEIVAEKAKKYGINIKIPGDFYSLIAARHGGPKKLEKQKTHALPEEIASWARQFPETKRLFHIDPYMRSTSAKILGIHKNHVVFDQTIFYPWAGGQDHDVGYVLGPGDKKLWVKRVYKVDNVIVHELEDTRDLKPNLKVEMFIDWIRRYILMRHHTATHIVLAAARKILGEHVWQAGAEKTVEKARLDITHYKPLSREEVEKIEDLANSIIDERIQLKFHYLPKFDAEKKFGLKIYQGGAVYSSILRIVEIPGWDAEACFGTHVHNTSEVGGIKIINAERIQDGVVRLEYIASTRLPRHMRKLEEEKNALSNILGVRGGDILSAAKKIVKEKEQLKTLVNTYRNEIKKTLMEKILNKKITICGLDTVVFEKKIADEQLYRSIIEELSLKKGYLVIYVSDNLIEIAASPSKIQKTSIDLSKLVNILRKQGVRGGGKRDHVYIRAREPKKTLAIIIEILRKTCI